MTAIVIPKDVIAAARAAMMKWKVPASVTIAQWAQESAWGAHMPPGSNNPFGIKAEPGEPFVRCWTTEIDETGEPHRVPADFRKYPSYLDSFDEHGKFLADNPRYKPAFATANGLLFAAAIAAEGYATDRSYGAALDSIISYHHLMTYDVDGGDDGPAALTAQQLEPSIAVTPVATPVPEDEDIAAMVRAIIVERIGTPGLDAFADLPLSNRTALTCQAMLYRMAAERAGFSVVAAKAAAPA